jgi:hypothetical protein
VGDLTDIEKKALGTGNSLHRAPLENLEECLITRNFERQ